MWHCDFIKNNSDKNQQKELYFVLTSLCTINIAEIEILFNFLRIREKLDLLFISLCFVARLHDQLGLSHVYIYTSYRLDIELIF